MASNFYRQTDGPRYILGHSLELGFIGLGIIAAVILIVAYSRINKQRETKLATCSDSDLSPEVLSAQGDRAITYRYVY